jgi:phosphoribosyl 1,2-cyclic phosphodiesterase/CheY-like chemotaxis protein
MDKKVKYFIVDDDRIFIKLLTKYLESDALSVNSNTSSADAIQEILRIEPDCLILDIMMPGINGLELCKKIRSKPDLKDMKIVIVSGKTYEVDRKQAFDAGADGYIVKPVEPEKIAEQIRRIVEDRIELIFWGIRGTLPVPGERTIRYGGNTSCVTVEFPKGNLFIFDAGTGIKSLSDHLMGENRNKIKAKIFISHPHWDHINALPFFAPIYRQGNEFEIIGPPHGDITIRELISGQMDGVYFPFNIKEFGSTVSFRDVKEETFCLEEATIKTLLLNHPGNCLGYRIDFKGRSICYLTDNELFPETNKLYNRAYIDKIKEFLHLADALIADSTYTDEEYEKKVGWGHSPITEIVKLADRARVKTLYLFHHDPDQPDDDIDKKYRKASALLKKRHSATTCVAPKEKQRFWI